MELKEINISEYQSFWEKHPLKTFLSSKEIANVRTSSRPEWNSISYGLYKDNQIIGATLLIYKKSIFNRYEYYSPRGILIDYNNKIILETFINLLKKELKKKKGYILRIDPYIYYKQRDLNGDIVKDGFDNSHIINNLKKIGFKKEKDEEEEQVSWMFSLNLEGKKEEEIFNEMRSNTRNIIRKTEKYGIELVELEYDELDYFQNILEDTGERKKFSTRSIKYIQNMYKEFNKTDSIKFIVAKLNLDNYINNINNELEDKKSKLSNLSDNNKNKGKRKELYLDIELLNKRINEAKEIIKTEKTNIITLSGSMMLFVKPEVLYLSSGNYDKFMKFNGQYLIQWEMIKYAINNGYKKYNFYGIPKYINTKPKDYGIYEFKKGFNGEVEQLIGEFYLPLSFRYKIIKLIKKTRQILKTW